MTSLFLKCSTSQVVLTILLKSMTFLLENQKPNRKSMLVILSSIGLKINYVIIVCKFVTYCRAITEDEEDTKQPIVLLSSDGLAVT